MSMKAGAAVARRPSPRAQTSEVSTADIEKALHDWFKQQSAATFKEALPSEAFFTVKA